MSIIQQGLVSWSGENPGIYLKHPQNQQAGWCVLALYFKVVVSAYGRGRGILLLGEPDSALGYPAAPNLCIADNLPLMRYLLDEYVPSFGAFKNVPSLAHVTLLQANQNGGTDSEVATAWRESIEAQGVRLEMRWLDLQPPFAADVGPTFSATGKHRMYSVFQGAQRAQVLLNDEVLPGVVIERDFLDGTLNSAFLAFGESWVEENRGQP